MESKVSLSYLPDEIMLQIFSHLEAKDLCTCAQISSQWRKFIDDQTLWRELCNKKDYKFITKNVPVHWQKQPREMFRWFHECATRIFDADCSKKEGRGSFHYEKSWYEGEWKWDKRNGLGRLIFKSGCIYEGDFKEDKKHGYGTNLWPDGSMYEGEWRDDKKNGQGLRDWGDGEYYQGLWIDDKQEGYGVYGWPDGSRYEGYNRDNKKWGKGTETWQNGDKYEGDYVDDNLHGIGTYTWNSGSKYVGEWRYSKMCGLGACTWPSGSSYFGEWKDSQRHGHGRYQWPDGDIYEGEWHAGCRYGKGKFIKSDGTVYLQEWCELTFDGSNKGKMDVVLPKSESLAPSPVLDVTMKKRPLAEEDKDMEEEEVKKYKKTELDEVKP